LLFPVSIYLFGPPRVRESKKKSGDKEKADLRTRMLKHPGKVGAAALIVVVLAAVGAGRVWIDTSFLANFEKDSDIVQTDRFINDHFGGTSTLNVIFSSEKPDTFKKPEVLRLMDEVQDQAEQNPQVGESFSIADYMKRMNKVMNEDNPAFDIIPETSDMIAQYLLLYEMSGDPDNLNRIVDYDYMYGNLTFQLKSDSSALLGELIHTIDGYGPEFEEQGVRIQYAGSGYKALIFADLLLEGQIISLLLSFGFVALLLTLLFKSILIGIVGTIPIAITAVVNFGTMGLLGIPLSSATALISSIAIGIGVDYAIHLIEHYRNCRMEGMDTGKAASETLRNTGRAIIYNAAAVMGGFSVLMISVFPPNRQVGGLIALNMATSAIGTLTLLLVVIVALDRKGRILK
ncbi:MAG: MMPL family transporter, partial [Spirochaetaceae bacterium]|nr:MMPL family transporter [Spirochaetaceae bacterium]